MFSAKTVNYSRKIAASIAATGGISLSSKSDAELGKSHILASNKGSFLLKTIDVESEAAKLCHEELTASKKLGFDLIKLREKQMAKNVSIFYKQDGGLVVTKGEGVYLIDMDGNKYLDCCNNVAHVGHSHPTVVAAGCKGLQNVQTNCRFLNPVQQRYLSKLLATFPPELNTVYLCNSGTEANDLALRIARAHTTAKLPNDVICIDAAYHGHSQAIVDISPYKWAQAVDGKNYQPKSTHVATLPDSFRGPHRGFTEETGKKYAQEVEEMVQTTGGVGVFIAEAVLGCGGQVVPPPGYLKACYDAVKSKGGVCIADEVQTGFGRSGTHFWMFQDHGVSPDIVTCGKPMGNGYPVAAVICRRELADSFASSGIEYFNTYGGNGVACGIAEAVLDTVLDEDLQGNSLRVGNYIKSLLVNLKDKYDWVGDVRGLGLYQGIELVHSRSVKDGKYEPYPELTKFVIDFLKCEHVITSRDGPDENVVKIKPPIIFTKENADTMISAIDRALQSAKDSGLY